MYTIEVNIALNRMQILSISYGLVVLSSGASSPGLIVQGASCLTFMVNITIVSLHC